MTNLTAPFIVVETRNGSTAPRSVWIADSEADYVNRVVAAHARYDMDGVETADQARSFDQEAHAMSVDLITRAEFDSYTLDSWHSGIVKAAASLGWTDEPDTE